MKTSKYKDNFDAFKITVVEYDKMKLKLKDTSKIRPCLRCGAEFKSHSAGNRICSECKHSASRGYLID